jgi:uncharacterized membrane protein
VEPVSRTEKSTTGLDANVAAAVSYLLGFITGIVFLVIEKDSKFVRFHAIQSAVIFGAIFVLWLVLLQIPFLGLFFGLLLMPLVSIGSFILWLILMFKAYNWEKFKVPVAGDIAEQNA